MLLMVMAVFGLLVSQSILEGKVVSLKQMVRELNSKLRAAKEEKQSLSQQLVSNQEQNYEKVLR